MRKHGKPRRLRVLVDGRTIADGYPGIGRATLNLCRALGQVVSDEELLLLVAPPDTGARCDLSALEALDTLRLIRTAIPRRVPAEQVWLPPLVRRLAPDVLHAPFFLRPFLVPCPVVVTIYDLIPLHPSWRRRAMLDRIVFRVGVALACRRSQAVLVPSRATRNALCRLLPGVEEKVTVAPLAADPGFSPCSREEVREACRRLGVDGPFVFHVGSRLPHKNTRSLIEAWRILRRDCGLDHPGLQLVVAGDVDAGEREAVHGVRFVGGVDDHDLRALYSGAELYVSTSLVEGFGMTVLEAMMCGTAVVCGSGGSLPEVVGDAARVVDVTDPVELALAIRDLVCDAQARSTLAALGARRCRRFSWERTAEKVLAAYHRVASP